MVSKRSERPRRVPCDQCIERASLAGTRPHELSLCDLCSQRLQKRHGPVFIPQVGTSARTAGSSRWLLEQDRLRWPQDSHLPAPSLSPAQPSTSELTETISRLEEYSRQFVEAVNSRDWKGPIFQHATSSVHVDMDVYEATSTLADNIETFKTIIADTPSYHVHVEAVHIILEIDGRTAHAYLNMAVSGRPVGLVLKSLGVMTYSRLTTSWQLVSFIAMRFSAPTI